MTFMDILLTLKIGDTEHKLTLDEARALYNDLHSLLGPRTTIYPQPSYVPYSPPWIGSPTFPWLQGTICGGRTTSGSAGIAGCSTFGSLNC